MNKEKLTWLVKIVKKSLLCVFALLFIRHCTIFGSAQDLFPNSAENSLGRQTQAFNSANYEERPQGEVRPQDVSEEERGYNFWDLVQAGWNQFCRELDRLKHPESSLQNGLTNSANNKPSNPSPNNPNNWSEGPDMGKIPYNDEINLLNGMAGANDLPSSKVYDKLNQAQTYKDSIKELTENVNVADSESVNSLKFLTNEANAGVNIASNYAKTPTEKAGLALTGYGTAKAAKAVNDPKNIKKMDEAAKNNDTVKTIDRGMRTPQTGGLRTKDKELKKIYVKNNYKAYQKALDQKLNNEYFNSEARRKAEELRSRERAFLNFMGHDNSHPSQNITLYKPNIYYYPTETMTVTTKFPTPWKLLTVIPDYPADTGWIVEAEPDGTLRNRDGAEYAFLFYEADVETDYFQTKEGFVVYPEDRSAFFCRILSAYGLNEAEIADFVEFWDEKLDPNVTYYMYPQMNDRAELTMPVTIDPAPESILRLWFLFTPAEEGLTGDGDSTQLTEPKIKHFEREGFTVVEWGGMVLETK